MEHVKCIDSKWLSEHFNDDMGGNISRFRLAPSHTMFKTALASLLHVILLEFYEDREMKREDVKTLKKPGFWCLIISPTQ